MMIITTLMFSISHIASKVFYTRCPEASGFDMVSAQGYTLVPFYFIYAKLKGVNLNLFNFEPKVRMLIILRVFIGITNNIALYAGLKYISIGKGVLIFSLSPLFCTITAGVFLNEQITLVNSALTFASFGGVYLLTLNKPQNEVDASMETFGYILTLTAALLYGVLFVVLRALNTYKISLLVSPFYSGVGTLSQTLFILIVKPDLIHSELYDSVNLSLLIWMGCWAVIAQFTMISANKYSAASKMAPINYAENVFTLLADVILFQYHFIFSDVAGMAIIIVCLVIPVIIKLRES